MLFFIRHSDFDICHCRGDASLRFRPHLGVAFVVEFDVNHVRPAADGAILDVFLTLPSRGIERNDDLFAAGIADVTGFVLHYSTFR